MIEKLRILGLIKGNSEPRRIIDTSKKYRQIVDVSHKYRHINPNFSESNPESITVFPGITQDQIDQLIDFSNNDKEIVRFTKDNKRFSTKEDFANWLAQGKQIYTLSNANQDLLGLIWFSHKEVQKNSQNYSVSFAIRLYQSARGKGLSMNFATTCIDDYLRNNPDVSSIWLKTTVDNLAAIKLYYKLGFEPTKVEGTYLEMTKTY